MKKAVITGVLSLFTVGLVSAQTANDELPQNAKDFIAKHFASETLTFVEKDNSWLPWDDDDMYEAYFSSGLELNFNKSGEMTEIEAANNQTIPTEVLPGEVLSYVGKNYQNAQIKSWSRDGKEQEVELTNGVDLEFDQNGKFLRVD